MTLKSNRGNKRLDTRDLRVERISYEELVGLTQEWQALLDLANRDHIFLSPAWVTSWWDTWGKHQPRFEPVILVVRSGLGQIIGIAPMYVSSDRVRGPFSCRRLQFIGTSFRKPGVTRTEYIDFLTHPQCRREVIESIISFIDEKCQCDELVLSDIRLDCATYDHMIEIAAARKWPIRHTGKDQGVSIPLDGSFESYLSNLGKNTRSRLYNRRKILQSVGDVHIVNYRGGQIEEAFTELNSLFRKRWQQDIFSDAQFQFQSTLLKRLPHSASVEMTGLHVDNVCVSVLYNIRYGETEYNFLSGFSESVHPKLSIGMLHFGYAIEKAYADGMRYFDLLLGKGRSSNYKKNFHGEDIKAETLQLISNPFLSLIYRAYDTVVRLWRNKGRK